MLVNHRGQQVQGVAWGTAILRAGSRRPILDGRDVLDNAATENAVNLGHRATLPRARERPLPFTKTPEYATSGPKVDTALPSERVRREFW